MHERETEGVCVYTRERERERESVCVYVYVCVYVCESVRIAGMIAAILRI